MQRQPGRARLWLHRFGVSVFNCPDEASLDTLFTLLSNCGQPMMPPASYPFATKYARFSDRCGVSWQPSVAARSGHPG